MGFESHGWAYVSTLQQHGQSHVLASWEFVTMCVSASV